jgi:hypothetical protein
MTGIDRIGRIALLIMQAFVAVTACAGGVVLILGSVNAAWSSVLVPPLDYLEGSPFSSYLVPGILLVVLVASVHALAFVATISDSVWTNLAAAAGGFACVIWIGVQMVFIPFSVLQAVYFVVGLVELGVTMARLGILEPVTPLHRTTFVSTRGQ